jgi:hypothetical protein
MFEGNIIVSASFSQEIKKNTDNITKRGIEKYFILL